ncbi:glycoside hydrolase family 3 protein [Cohnella algarum]|uniref:glycoside hydrolase family 3 protein n=1 Tax=Cohnella algarum TaxID=2044859 RepID=UPI001F0757A8|nr:glycoside hydrolase family 3 protein [Cohnella algarum]
MSDKYEYPFQNPELPLETRVNDLVSRLTMDEKVDLMCQYQEEIPRLGIRKYKHGTEAAHGIAWLGEATYFPQPVGLACTWDAELLRRVGEAIGTEARGFFRRDPAINGLTLWAPTVDMERDPRWGRNEEAYGEDPVLAGKLGAALVRGMQGDHPFYVRAVASLKHFIGNNNEKDRGECSVSIDPRNMREYYLKAFEIPFVEGGALSMMTAYNAVNGVPANLNSQVNDVVKREWGMNGFVVSDAGDVLGTVNDHKYFDNYAEAVARSIRSGIDSITDDHAVSKQAIRDALKAWLLTENDLDTALRNAFRVRFRLGEFDPDDRNPYASIDESVICAPDHRQISLEAARKNVVLLKNEGGALPLRADKIRRLAVIGPLAGDVFRDWYSGTLPYAVTPLQAIRGRLGSEDRVLFADGSDRIKLKVVDEGRHAGRPGDGKPQGAEEERHAGLAPEEHGRPARKDGARYVGLTAEGKLAASVADENEAETFARTDWGWRAHTFRPLSRPGRYLTTKEGGHVTADADEIFGWFTKEVFLTDTGADGRLTLSAWDDGPIAIGEDGLLAASEGGAVKDVHGNWVGGDQAGAGARAAFEPFVVEDGVREAVNAAREADAAVVFVGNHPLVNGKETIDRPDIALPESQDRLIRDVFAANPNTIVVIVGSYPFAVNWADEHVPAIMYTSHAGPELGTAIANVLFGDYAPAGRLNMTWYRSVDQLPDFMDYDIIKGERTYRYFKGDVLYPFGHGLTYSRFEYENLRLGRPSVGPGEEVEVAVTVRNAGDRASEEVAQLYGTARGSRVKRPLRQLLGFARIALEAGESREVSFSVRADDLAFWDVTRDRWCVEAGEWELAVGRSSADLALRAELRVEGEIVPPRDLRRVTAAVNYDDYEGVVIDECREGGSSAAAVREGAMLRYADAAFGEREAVCFEARVSAAEGGTIAIRAEAKPEQRPGAGEPVGVCTVPATAGEQAWVTVTCAVSGLRGSADVVLEPSRGVRISWFRFV